MADSRAALGRGVAEPVAAAPGAPSSAGGSARGTPQAPAAPESPFLIDFFTVLRESRIEYCVERNHEGLPYNLCGHDIDILVRRASVGAVLRIIEASARRHGGRTTSAGTQRDGLHWVICLGNVESGIPWGVRIDLKPNLRWNGLEIGDLGAALTTATWRGIVRVQEPDTAALFGLLKHTLFGGHPAKNRYHLQAAAAYQRAPEKITGLVNGLFGRRGDCLLEILRTGQWYRMAACARQLRRSLHVRQLAASPLRVLRNKFAHLLVYCRRILNRPGMWVAVLGSDGAGKSTLIERVRPDLERLLHTNTTCYHFRPGLFPALGVLAGRGAQTGPVTNPHAAPPSGPVGSALRMAYYTFDYFWGFALRIYPALLRNPNVVFFDRYFHEYFVDPARCRVRAPRWVVRFFSWFVPKPDLVVLLTAPPEVLHERKPELPMEELRLQRRRFEELAGSLREVVWVDTSGEVERSGEVLLRALLERFGRHLRWH